MQKCLPSLTLSLSHSTEPTAAAVAVSLVHLLIPTLSVGHFTLSHSLTLSHPLSPSLSCSCSVRRSPSSCTPSLPHLASRSPNSFTHPLTFSLSLSFSQLFPFTHLLDSLTLSHPLSLISLISLTSLTHLCPSVTSLYNDDRYKFWCLNNVKKKEKLYRGRVDFHGSVEGRASREVIIIPIDRILFK